MVSTAVTCRPFTLSHTASKTSLMPPAPKPICYTFEWTDFKDEVHKKSRTRSGKPSSLGTRLVRLWEIIRLHFENKGIVEITDDVIFGYGLKPR